MFHHPRRRATVASSNEPLKSVAHQLQRTETGERRHRTSCNGKKEPSDMHFSLFPDLGEIFPFSPSLGIFFPDLGEIFPLPWGNSRPNHL